MFSLSATDAAPRLFLSALECFIMLARILLPVAFGASAALACAASTKCIPDVYARQFTLIQGRADAVLVQEYSILANGCTELVVDSIARRAVSLDSMRVQKNWQDGQLAPSAAATVYAHYDIPTLDSAKRAVCAKNKVLRRLDSIPRASTYYTPEGTDLSIESVVPVDTDSVYVCLANDGCSKVATRRVLNVDDPEICLVGALAPYHTQEEALAYLQTRLLKAIRVERLRRLRIAYAIIDVQCAVMYDDLAAARTASLAPVRVKEDRFSFIPYPYAIYGLHSVDWAHSAISPRLALPSDANVGDYHGHDSLLFVGSPLRDSTRTTPYSYANGVERYVYRGTYTSPYACTTEEALPKPLIVGDTLRLEGLTLGLSTGSTCAAPGIDNYADAYNEWLYAPSDDDFQKNFTHSISAETQTSWPIVNDSVQIRGQKVALATLQAFVSTLPRQGRLAPLAARMADGFLSVTLENPSNVRVSTPDGRVLSSSRQPAGTSRIALPRHHHGLLLVDAGSSSARVMTP